MNATLTPFGQAVYDNMTVAELERELEPSRFKFLLDAERDICHAWGMTDDERVQQLRLVLDIKRGAR